MIAKSLGCDNTKSLTILGAPLIKETFIITKLVGILHKGLSFY